MLCSLGSVSVTQKNALRFNVYWWYWLRCTPPDYSAWSPCALGTCISFQKHTLYVEWHLKIFVCVNVSVCDDVLQCIGSPSSMSLSLGPELPGIDWHMTLSNNNSNKRDSRWPNILLKSFVWVFHFICIPSLALHSVAVVFSGLASRGLHCSVLQLGEHEKWSAVLKKCTRFASLTQIFSSGWDSDRQRSL